MKELTGSLSPYMPCHVNYDENHCCGIFNVLEEGMIICNECGMTITKLIDNLDKKYKDFIPTAENINNLPEKIRGYIKELGTTCDPAGVIQDNACLLENIKALTRKCKILKMQIDLMSFFVPTDKMNKIEEDAEISLYNDKYERPTNRGGSLQ